MGRAPGELWEQPALIHTSYGCRRPSVIPSTLSPASFSSNAMHRAHLHCKISCFEGSAGILHVTPVTKLEGKVTGGNRNPSHSLAAPKQEWILLSLPKESLSNLKVTQVVSFQPVDFFGSADYFRQVQRAIPKQVWLLFLCLQYKWGRYFTGNCGVGKTPAEAERAILCPVMAIWLISF